jgi:pimeloyl-ACP methyl ester carboxylesterase
MTTHARDIFVTANGLRHHLIARGSPGQPVVLLIHGLTQQAHVFDAIAARLGDSYHVYALDVRGRGESEWGAAQDYAMPTYVEDLEAVREALGLESFSLLGTSMGGLIAMYYSAQHPERVLRLVMNDIGPEIDRQGLQRIQAMASSAPEAFTDLKAVAKYYREENGPVLARRSDDEVVEYARWHVRRSDNGLYVWKMDPAIRQPQPGAARAADPWEAYRRVKCPVLLVRGSTSDILSRQTVERMKRESPHVSTVEVANVGHAPSLAEPEAESALLAFLASEAVHEKE